MTKFKTLKGASNKEKRGSLQYTLPVHSRLNQFIKLNFFFMQILIIILLLCQNDTKYIRFF